MTEHELAELEDEVQDRLAAAAARGAVLTNLDAFRAQTFLEVLLGPERTRVARAMFARRVMAHLDELDAAASRAALLA